MKLDTLEYLLIALLINAIFWTLISMVFVFDIGLVLNIKNDIVYGLQFITGVILFLVVKKLDIRIFSELINNGKI